MDIIEHALRQEELNLVAILICFDKKFECFRRVIVVEIESKAFDYIELKVFTNHGILQLVQCRKIFKNP